MRTHAQIISDAGGPQAIHDLLGFRDRMVTVRSWLSRNSIPSAYWAALEAQGKATATELAIAAAKVDPAARRASAQAA